MNQQATAPIEPDVPFPLQDFLPQAPAEPVIVTEPSHQVPVVAEADVVVVGGGPTGACAAAAAARAGRSVVLIERHGFLGGMITAANVTILHSLYGMDGQTRIIGGLSEELIRRLQALDATRNIKADGETGCWQVSAEICRFVYDDMVLSSGVKLMLHSQLAVVIADGRRLDAVLVEGKTGRGAVRGRSFIDCTGDADLTRRAGLATLHGDGQGHCQPPTLCFRVVDQTADWPDVQTLQQELLGVQRELSQGVMDYNGKPYGCFLWGNPALHDDREVMLAGTRVHDVDAGDTRSLTRAEVEARYQVRWILKRMKTIDGFSNVRLSMLPAQIGTRESHRIQAEHVLGKDEVIRGDPFDDAIALGTYPIDIHEPGGGGITFYYLNGGAKHVAADSTVKRWRWDGADNDAPPRDTLCYQIPYRSLVPRGIDNLLAAGRCVGAVHEAAGAIRVMVNTMQLGHAAGTAAALRAEGEAFANLDTANLARQLETEGMPLSLARN